MPSTIQARFERSTTSEKSKDIQNKKGKYKGLMGDLARAQKRYLADSKNFHDVKAVYESSPIFVVCDQLFSTVAVHALQTVLDMPNAIASLLLTAAPAHSARNWNANIHSEAEKQKSATRQRKESKPKKKKRDKTNSFSCPNH